MNIPRERRIFTNRTLNMHGIRAIGYDMDYTLVHYDVTKWEKLAFQCLKKRLLHIGWPVQDAEFKNDFAMRGLVIDRKLGNIVKANRFGYIKKAVHGFAPCAFEDIRAAYRRDFIDLADRRWSFVNTFFSLSELCMFAYAVEAADRGDFNTRISYAEMADTIRKQLDNAHIEGDMKRIIVRNPDDYIVLDPDAPQTLLDQKNAGKKVMLITNSDWTFTNAMMRYAYNPYLGKDKNWTDLFDLIIVSARKPVFFTQNTPIYRVNTDDNTLSPVNAIDGEHKVYESGNAQLVESFFQFGGDAILYAGDHVFSDVNVSKAVRRWRTCLILRELENEIAIQKENEGKQRELETLMQQIADNDEEIAQTRLQIQRTKIAGCDPAALFQKHAELRATHEKLENEIAPRAIAAGELYNPIWGLLMRTGNDKSLMARQMEQHADIYTSRISNFMFATPFAYLRSFRGSLPHD